MCGILGFVGPNTFYNRDLVKALLLQLSLRGTHATGLSVLVNGVLRTCMAPMGAKEFFEHVTLDTPNPANGLLKVIAHTRYSTSDLKWNQPIEDGHMGVVMNGVISQEPPDKWPFPTEDSGCYVTGNDAEIALKFAQQHKRAEMPGSWAICSLDTSGQLLAYRNTHRPMWLAEYRDCVIACSTADALLRCGVTGISQAEPFEVYDLSSSHPLIPVNDSVPRIIKDLQPGFNGLWPDLQCSI